MQLKEKNQTPLTTVIVVTYNSGKFVLETLESIKNQTYPNIELIISDDASKDNTLDICYKWIKRSKQRFTNCCIIESKQNYGTAHNINKAIIKSNGVNIKLIAADDIMLPDYLSFVTTHLLENPKKQILYTNTIILKSNGKLDYDVNKFHSRRPINSPTITPEKQSQILLRFNHIFAASVIVRKDVYDQIGLFNESFPLCEDLFFWFKAVKSNIKIHYADFYGIKYRKHDDSVQVFNSEKKLFTAYEMDLMNGILYLFLPHYPFKERLLVKFIYSAKIYLSKVFNNKRTILSNLLIKTICTTPEFLLKLSRYKYFK